MASHPSNGLAHIYKHRNRKEKKKEKEKEKEICENITIKRTLDMGAEIIKI